MKKVFLFIVIIPLVIFCSCSRPLGRKYSAKTFEHDIEEINQTHSVSSENMELLVKYIIISKLSGNDQEGETYNDILEKVKSLNAVNKSLTSQQKNDEVVKRQRLSKFLSVNLEQKDFSKIKNKDVLTYSVSFQNLGRKDIATVIGSLNDLIEKEIKKIDIVLDEDVKTGSTIKKNYTINYDGANENDRRIRSKELIDMRIEWNPEKIIFKDGKIAD